VLTKVLTNPAQFRMKFGIALILSPVRAASRIPST
jgi:hypothetical protein